MLSLIEGFLYSEVLYWWFHRMWYAVVMAVVVMYVQCIGTWCMTCFITF